MPSMTDNSLRGIQIQAVCVYVEVGDVHAHHCFDYYSPISLTYLYLQARAAASLYVSVAFAFDTLDSFPHVHPANERLVPIITWGAR